MDILTSEQNNFKCKKHPDREVQFINTNLMKDKETESLYFCDICISEDISFSHKNIISIRQIIVFGEKNIIQKWPPVNNYQTLKDLSQITTQNQNRKVVQTRISDLFSELKHEIVQELDIIQKKIINKLQNSFDQLDINLKNYQQISKIDQLRNILIEMQQNSFDKTKDLEVLLEKLQSQKSQNTQVLEKMLENSKLFVHLLNGDYVNEFKDSMLSYMKTLSSIVSTEPVEQGSSNIRQSLFNLKISDYLSSEANNGQLMKLLKEPLNYLSKIFGFEQQNNVIQNMIQSDFAQSKEIDVIPNENQIIQLIPKKLFTSAQLYSQQKIDQNKIYEFIIGFKQKPTNYLCLGFEEEQFKNRYLGIFGLNSFILGQQNSMFCQKLIKGNKNLQALCEEEFVEKLVIQVLLSENKFYIADYPQKRSVNCMDEAKYSFKKDSDYFFVIHFHNQSTQVDILSNSIIESFTII